MAHASEPAHPNVVRDPGALDDRHIPVRDPGAHDGRHIPQPRRSSITDGLQLSAADEPAEHSKKKRRHKGQSAAQDEQRHRADVDTGSHSSKRRRSSNWPLAEEPLSSPETQHSRRSRHSVASHSRRQAASPGRSSRFQEASMHDRASSQPPSMFTRFVSVGGVSSVDQLMEDYHAANEAADPGRAMRATSRGPSHHPNRSTTSAMTGGTAATRESGVFRFGRSVAASFNPLNIWHKMQQRWSEARQELIEEDLDEQARQLMERAAKAEEIYAHLKRTGQLGAQGTHGIPIGTQIYTPGYAAPADQRSTQRDSGIAGIEPHDSRPYDRTEAPKGAANLSSPPERKSALHFKTRSFANLKKVRSDAHIGRKPASSPEKEQPETPNTLRKSQSRKDLQKQLKLSKRVSDLETKLQDARRDLYSALGDTPPPPVPALPTHLSSSMSGNKPRIPFPFKMLAKTGGGLPSLPSERLLPPEQSDNREDFLVSSLPPVPQKDGPTAAPQSTVQLDAPTTNDIWTADIAPAKLKKKQAKAPATKKRKSGDENDMTYNPSPNVSNDAESEPAAAQEAPKRKRGRPRKHPLPDDHENRKQSDDSSKQTEAAAPTRAPPPPPTDTRTVDAVQITETSFKVVEGQPGVHASIAETLEDAVVVHEEQQQRSMTTTKVSLKDSPSKPTAFATPSTHPGMRRGRSSSPANTAARTDDDDGWRENFSELSDDDIVCVVPNGTSVPPMPAVPENMMKRDASVGTNVRRNGGSFEWPEDVF